MSVEIATTSGGVDRAPVPVASAGAAAIDREVEVLEKAARLIPTLIDGGMVPAIYSPTHRPKNGAPEQGREAAIQKAIAAAVYGASLGFGATQSLQNVFTVHGMPAIYARTAVSLAQAAGHEVWTEESSADSVTVCARRRGSENVERSTWTMERAKIAGFTSNAKYKTQPEEMLYAKAAMAVCRRAFADVLGGVAYSVEELELEPRPVKMTATRVAPAKRGASGLRERLSQGFSDSAGGLPEPEAAEDEGPDLLAAALSELAAADTQDGVTAVVNSWAADLSNEQNLRLQADARARWHSLAAPVEGGSDV